VARRHDTLPTTTMSDEHDTMPTRDEDRMLRPRPARRGLPFNFLFGLLIGSVTLLTGVAVLSGLIFDPVPPEVRYTCGVVLVLLSLYRIIVTVQRRRTHETLPEE
jgi:hypothetical protein